MNSKTAIRHHYTTPGCLDIFSASYLLKKCPLKCLFDNASIYPLWKEQTDGEMNSTTELKQSEMFVVSFP